VMDTGDSSTGNDFRRGHGLLECPLSNCQMTLIGSYTELLDHIVSTHTESDIAREQIDGEKILNQIRSVKAQALWSEVQDSIG
jgi:hypothetical protein